MKKVLPLVLLGLSLSTSLAYADALPEGQKSLAGCAVLQNTSAFAGVKFIVSHKDMDATFPTIEVLTDETCAEGGKYETVLLFAVDADEFEKKRRYTGL